MFILAYCKFSKLENLRYYTNEATLVDDHMGNLSMRHGSGEEFLVLVYTININRRRKLISQNIKCVG